MKLILPLMLMLTTMAHADFDSDVRRVYPETLVIVQEAFPGPLANDLTRFAVLRFVHENGEKPTHYAVPGLGCGGWNWEILESLLFKLGNPLKVGRVQDAEGECMMSLTGPGAHPISAAAIAHLFNFYITWLGFNESEKLIWRRANAYSYIASCGSSEYRDRYMTDVRPQVHNLLRRANRMYGPGAERIESKVK